MPKDSLKDKLEGNELDLSLSELTVVPVKEIAAIPKATQLDLSCNLLATITPDFCNALKNLVRLDLSKNQLTELPENIGSLHKLQNLDLYQNRLHTLPMGFCYLKSLRWLDLKDNPLVEPISAVAGDCLNDAQCKKCAKNVVEFMKQVESRQERERQKRLHQERELEAARKAEEEKERQRKKEEKRIEKEQRRREYEAHQAELRQQEQVERDTSDDTDPDSGSKKKVANGVNLHTKENTGGFGCCGVLLAMLFGLIALVVGLYFYCDTHPKDVSCKTAQTQLHHYYSLAHTHVEQIIQKFNK